MSEAHLALMTKLEELDAYTHTVLHQFPKLERHLLCAEMRAATNKLLRLAVVAWKRRQKSGALFASGCVFIEIVKETYATAY